MLVDRFDANLLLVGRGVLDERREAILDRLRQRGRSIAYASVDVCDESRLTAVVNEYTARAGRSIDGVVHLAGIYYESVAVDDAADRFLAMLRPKSIGTSVLHRLLAAQGGGFLIASSSIAGFFGGASIGAYAAANSFQEAFAAHARDEASVTHYCFSWSNWNDVGQSRQYQLKDAPRVRGYQTIAPSQGLQSLLIGLRFSERHLLVGLDARHRHIRRSLVDEPDLLDKPVVYYTASNGCRPESSLRAVEIRDRFGASSSAEACASFGCRSPTTERWTRAAGARRPGPRRRLGVRYAANGHGAAPGRELETGARRSARQSRRQLFRARRRFAAGGRDSSLTCVTQARGDLAALAL
jgi:hypothetical protein